MRVCTKTDRKLLNKKKLLYWNNWSLLKTSGKLILLVSCSIFLLLSGGEEDSQIGDGVRSSVSSLNFFKSVDQDSDGVLRASEVANFLETEIGRTSFVSSFDLDSEAKRVIRVLDQNSDGLDLSDVFEYWKHLENLLTAEEVAEWVVHAVQVPEYIGKVFLDNLVTGYDFPELVQNNGEALLTELGIEKSSFRKKIVRLVHARMLGIGSVPQPPKKIKFQLENCYTVNCSWDKSVAPGFPVHSYRAQRRAIRLENSTPCSLGNYSQDICSSPSSDDILKIEASDTCQLPNEKLLCQQLTNWLTIYRGADTEFIDNLLEPGYVYIYRIQAWNAVGRSSWDTVDISSKQKKQKCTKSSNYSNVSRSYDDTNNSNFHFFSSLLSTFNNCFLFLIACSASFMRWKRASAKSSVATLKVPFPRLWKRINQLSSYYTGFHIIPEFLFLDQRNERHHDIWVKAVGLNGYCKEVTLQENDKPIDRRVKFTKSHSTNNLSNDNADINNLQPKGIVVSGLLKIDSTNENSNGQYESIQENYDTNRNRGHEYDDPDICNTCRKRYKFGKRWRHHCARCLSTFCHKHGRTTHSNLTSCKVPGTCLCNKCLEME